MLLSIVIATKNRESILNESLSHALESIKNKDDFEIIVVNDGIEMTEKIISNRVVYLNNNQSGVSKARNYGARIAKSDFLFFCDDDMWLNVSFIDWFLSHKSDLDFENQVFNINWSYPEALIQKMKTEKIGRYLLASNYETMWGRMHISKPKYEELIYNGIGSCSMLIHKQVFNKINGYNEKIIFQGEDIDFSTKLNNHNIVIKCIFNITLHHNHQDRIQINQYLEREYSGYKSQNNAYKNGFLLNSKITKYSFFKYISFTILKFIENHLIFLLKNIIPNHTRFDAINHKMIGILASLQKFKAENQK